jgi:ribosomal protein L21E
MANKSTNTFKKREREEAKRRKRIAKDAKKVVRKELKLNKDGEEIIVDVDPDIAGIVPGPQPKCED